MSKFQKMSHTIWHCEYHIVWVPKYRYRVLQGKVKEEVEFCVRDQAAQMGCETVEINVQADHVHMVVKVLPKLSISEYMGRIKGKSAIRLLKRVQRPERPTVLGESFLGARVLCRNGWLG